MFLYFRRFYLHQNFQVTTISYICRNGYKEYETFSLCLDRRLLPAVLSVACSRKEADYTIAVSQCSEDDWRAQMNKEILREALFYPGVNIEVYQAHDDNVRQIQDIESLIKKRLTC